MLKQIIKIILEAGNLVANLRQNNSLIVEKKPDHSLVTNADTASEKLILDRIYSYFGKDQIILSEESVANGYVPNTNNHPFWLIDPIDATASYVEGKNDYCINITYLENHTPVIGLIYAPSLHTLWYAEKGKGAYKMVDDAPAERIQVRTIPQQAIAVTSKRGHQLTPGILSKYNIHEEIVVASAIKFAYIAEGKADYYFRTKNKACDWDIASGEIIVTEAGGEVILTDLLKYNYGVKPFLAPSLIAKGKSI